MTLLLVLFNQKLNFNYNLETHDRPNNLCLNIRKYILFTPNIAQNMLCVHYENNKSPSLHVTGNHSKEQILDCVGPYLTISVFSSMICTLVVVYAYVL